MDSNNGNYNKELKNTISEGDSMLYYINQNAAIAVKSRNRKTHQSKQYDGAVQKIVLF